MNEDESLKQALAPFSREPEPVAISADARARILMSMRAGVRALPRARRRNRLVRAVATGVALAACAGLASWRFEAAPRDTNAGVVATGDLAWTDAERAEHVLHGEQRIVGDAAFSVPAGSVAALTTTAGVRMRLSEKTRMRVRGKADRVDLDRGSVSCEVPKLGPARSFEVHAGSARVIVHGTAFRVSLEEATTPCVTVREGLVEVQSAAESVMLHPGESWGCPVAVVPAAEPAVEKRQPPRAQAERVVPARVRARHHRRGEIADPPQRSTLGLENALLSSALHAERSHDVTRARALFEELLRRFPDSPLAPEARAGMQRNAP